MLLKPGLETPSLRSLNTEIETVSSAEFFSLLILATRASPSEPGGNTVIPLVKKSKSLSVFKNMEGGGGREREMNMRAHMFE